MERIENFENFDDTKWHEVRIHVSEGTKNLKGIISGLKEINSYYPESHYICSNSANEVETVTTWHMYYPPTTREEVVDKIEKCLSDHGFVQGSNGFQGGEIIECPCKS